MPSNHPLPPRAQSEVGSPEPRLLLSQASSPHGATTSPSVVSCWHALYYRDSPSGEMHLTRRIIVAVPVFDEEAMRAVVGCARGRLRKTSDEWLDETRGPVPSSDSLLRAGREST